MTIYEFPPKSSWNQILKRPINNTAAFEQGVKETMLAVKEKGDAALIELTERFDNIKLDALLVSDEEIQYAIAQVPGLLKEAIEKARLNIEKFHLAQREQSQKIETIAGVTCWRKSVGISRVGLYIPGGTAPLFSTILMLGVPANIAGCDEIILCTPPNKEGKIHPAILYTAHSLGIRSIFKVGGAQAIAAMAYGTESISKVYKIFGPGNQFVTLAKQFVNKEGVAIDMPAGPSEVAVLADHSCNPAFVAADLLSQAEHGADSQVVLLATEKSIIEKVNFEIDVQLKKLPRKNFAESALKNSVAILVKSIDEAMDILNEYGPEHLILQVENFEQVAQKVINAGSVFLGNYTPEAAGDYASGTNHTLPTNGFAKAYSGVSLDSFVKKITFQYITKSGIKNLGPTIEIMAEAEQLEAHRNAVSLRIKD